MAQAASTAAAPVTAAAGAGGDDAIVFGLGIGIGDVRLTRLGGADGADLLVEGRRQPIGPGMSVQAEIRTGRRHIIQHLLSPISRAMDEAARER